MWKTERRRERGRRESALLGENVFILNSHVSKWKQFPCGVPLCRSVLPMEEQGLTWLETQKGTEPEILHPIFKSAFLVCSFPFGGVCVWGNRPSFPLLQTSAEKPTIFSCALKTPTPDTRKNIETIQWFYRHFCWVFTQHLQPEFLLNQSMYMNLYFYGNYFNIPYCLSSSWVSFLSPTQQHSIGGTLESWIQNFSYRPSAIVEDKLDDSSREHMWIASPTFPERNFESQAPFTNCKSRMHCLFFF